MRASLLRLSFCHPVPDFKRASLLHLSLSLSSSARFQEGLSLSPLSLSIIQRQISRGPLSFTSLSLYHPVPDFKRASLLHLSLSLSSSARFQEGLSPSPLSLSIIQRQISRGPLSFTSLSLYHPVPDFKRASLLHLSLSLSSSARFQEGLSPSPLSLSIIQRQISRGPLSFTSLSLYHPAPDFKRASLLHLCVCREVVPFSFSTWYQREGNARVGVMIHC